MLLLYWHLAASINFLPIMKIHQACGGPPLAHHWPTVGSPALLVTNVPPILLSPHPLHYHFFVHFLPWRGGGLRGI